MVLGVIYTVFPGVRGGVAMDLNSTRKTDSVSASNVFRNFGRRYNWQYKSISIQNVFCPGIIFARDCRVRTGSQFFRPFRIFNFIGPSTAVVYDVRFERGSKRRLLILR